MNENELVKVMFDNMVANGVPPEDAGAILRFRYDHVASFTFTKIMLYGCPTTGVIVQRGDGVGMMMLAVVTNDMFIADADGNKISGPPDKSAMN